jgi:hypothetical protein
LRIQSEGYQWRGNGGREDGASPTCARRFTCRKPTGSQNAAFDFNPGRVGLGNGYQIPLLISINFGKLILEDNQRSILSVQDFTRSIETGQEQKDSDGCHRA